VSFTLFSRLWVRGVSSSPFAAGTRGISAPLSAAKDDASLQTIFVRERGRLRELRGSSFFATFWLLPALCACGGGGQSTSGGLPQGASAPLAPGAAINETLSDAALIPAAPFVAGPNDLLYVANAGNKSITVYHTAASGNAAPVATIVGSKTKLNYPGQLSEDANGDLYVSNVVGAPGSPPSDVLVFKHGANGNVAPIRVIAGPHTGLSAAYGVTATVDRTTGEIFAMAETGSQGNSNFLRFAANASGDAAPLATVLNTLTASEIAFDSTGRNIINASGGCCDSVATFGVYTYEKQFKNGGMPPIYTIDNFFVRGIADDPTTKTYLVTTSGGIYRFDEDTAGHGSVAGGPPAHFSPPIVSIVTSDTCGSQLALGYERDIYAAHSTFNGTCPEDAVYVYEHDASENAAPLRILTGSATKLDQPSGIYEGT
jgi:hypothetical protein